jgi:hypothetical protein
MSDSNTPPTAPEPAVDPVAAARAIMAGQEAKTDVVGSLQKQVRALWIVVGITAFLVVILAIFTLLPRFGVRMGGVGGRGNFQPGMGQNFQGQGQGPGQGQGQGPGQGQGQPGAPGTGQ